MKIYFRLLLWLCFMHLSFGVFALNIPPFTQQDFLTKSLDIQNLTFILIQECLLGERSKKYRNLNLCKVAKMKKNDIIKLF